MDFTLFTLPAKYKYKHIQSQLLLALHLIPNCLYLGSSSHNQKQISLFVGALIVLLQLTGLKCKLQINIENVTKVANYRCRSIDATMTW